MSGRPAPPKPWERTGASGAASSSASPAEGLPKPWEAPNSGMHSGTVVPASLQSLPAAQNGAAVPSATYQQPARPWEHPGGPGIVGSSSYGTGYGAGYGGSLYNRPAYGGNTYGSAYGGAYTPGYGGSNYVGFGSYGGYAGVGGAGGYGSGILGGGGLYGRPMMGSGMYGAGYGAPRSGPWDPNNPVPPGPPSAWQAMLASISNAMHFFSRLSFLVDENAHAVHFFVSALLQLLDRFGSLYGELARFVLRLLGFRPKDKAAPGPAGPQLQGAVGAPPTAGTERLQRLGPTQGTANGGGAPWDSVWGAKKQL